MFGRPSKGAAIMESWHVLRAILIEQVNVGVSKNRGKTPKMDGENFMEKKHYEQMDDLGGFPIIFGSTPKCVVFWVSSTTPPSW